LLGVELEVKTLSPPLVLEIIEKKESEEKE